MIFNERLQSGLQLLDALSFVFHEGVLLAYSVYVSHILPSSRLLWSLCFKMLQSFNCVLDDNSILLYDVGSERPRSRRLPSLDKGFTLLLVQSQMLQKVEVHLFAKQVSDQTNGSIIVRSIRWSGDT